MMRLLYRSCLLVTVALGALTVDATSQPRATASSSFSPSSSSPLASTTQVHVSLSTRHALSPFIYGVNFATAQLVKWGVSVNRNSGDAASKYNWKIDYTNSANDYYWLGATPYAPNQPPTPPNSSFVDGMYTRSVDSPSTVFINPLNALGWVVKSRDTCGSFPVATFGPQQRAVNGFGNGILTNGTQLDSSWDCFRTYGLTDNVEWLQHMQSLRGEKALSQRLWLQPLDNEPDCFAPVHRDVHPRNFGYDEMWATTLAHGTLAHQIAPAVHLNGPSFSNYCWWNFVRGDGCSIGGQDFKSHGSVLTMPWLLGKMNEYYLLTGIKLLDSVDLHVYPNGIPATDNTEAQQRVILDEVRSFYDWSYNDPGSFGQCGARCGGPALAMLPRFLGEVQTYAPDMDLKVTFSEYAFGFNDSVYTSALAVTEVLALMGHWGGYMSARWTSPTENTHAEQSFKVFLNYDSNGSKITGEAVNVTSSNSPNQTAYSVFNEADNTLFVLFFNRNLDSAGNATFSVRITDAQLLNSSKAQSAAVYTMTPTQWQLEQRETAEVESDGMSVLSLQLVVSARGFSMLVIPNVRLADSVQRVEWKMDYGPSPEQRYQEMMAAHDKEGPVDPELLTRLNRMSLETRAQKHQELRRRFDAVAVAAAPAVPLPRAVASKH